MKKASWKKWLLRLLAKRVRIFLNPEPLFRIQNFHVYTSTRIHVHIQIELARPHVSNTYPDAL